jgi:hypothetical protein
LNGSRRFFGVVGTAGGDAFRVLNVQDFEGVAIEDGDDGSGEVCRDSGAREQKVTECSPDGKHGATCWQASGAVKRNRYQLL